MSAGIMSVPLLYGSLFEQLGGRFVIGTDGRRGRQVPEFDFCDLPQPLAEDAPHARFHSIDEWRGALKLVEIALDRLDADDRAMVYDAYADAAVDMDRLDGAILGLR
ncbi:MAG: hypothetical protein GW859_07050 [Sphingomonadales bacterium]|nr:hypothetical protein [Sphingomonadales bacterium]